MSYTKAKIRKFCTIAEMKIVEKSFPSEIKKLSAADLQKKIKMVRGFRDKQRDLYKRQAIAMRKSVTGSVKKPTALHARAKEKQIIFDEALKRFQEQLSAAKKSSPKSAAKKPAKKKHPK